MEYFFILLGVVFIIAIIIYKENKFKNDISILLEDIAKEYKFKVEKAVKKSYDYKLIKEDITLLVSVVKVPSNSAITINSKNTWSLTWGGSSKNPGRAKPNQRYMDELTSFLNYKIKDNKVEKKVIILYKETEKVQKYLNESELEIINTGDLCYDYYVITYKDFKDCFRKIL